MTAAQTKVKCFIAFVTVLSLFPTGVVNARLHTNVESMIGNVPSLKSPRHSRQTKKSVVSICALKWAVGMGEDDTLQLLQNTYLCLGEKG